MKINSYSIYRFISFITGKRVKTIKMYFYRNKLDTTNPSDVIKYLLKFM